MGCRPLAEQRTACPPPAATLRPYSTRLPPSPQPPALCTPRRHSREGGEGIQRAIVHLGDTVEPYVVPVELVQTGGSQGPPSTWTHSVQDAVYGRAMRTDIDPTASPHQWRRPAAWRMAPATLGYAHCDSYGGFVLGWINEMPI